ncbi:MAG: hypothetical protein U0136_13260 [Bdellovibrionota bacterium]
MGLWFAGRAVSFVRFTVALQLTAVVWAPSAGATPDKPSLGAPETPAACTSSPTPLPSPHIPSPTPSATPIPSPSATPTPTPTRTPTPTPSGSPTPFPTLPPLPICPYYKIQAFASPRHPNAQIFEPTLLTPSCVYQEVEKAFKTCRAIGVSDFYMDECVVLNYFGQFGGPIKGPWPPANKVCNQKGLCTATLWYLDSSCHPIAQPNPIQKAFACEAGFLTVLASPISLIWETGYNLENDVRVTNFPLSPDSTDRFFEWKASERAPLLVWDPEHKGEVTSASQLFGEWTFGGKRYASLTESVLLPETSRGRAGAWRDGFEALGALDTNSDGEVSGSELASLGLWFDTNRDGVSQPGEVKSLAEMKVTKLSYRNGTRDRNTRSITIEKGYERLVDGIAQSGKAVDWYAESGATAFSLLGKKLAAPSVCGGTAQPKQCSGTYAHVRPDERSDPEAKRLAVSVSGGWQWTLDAASKAEGGFVTSPEGMFFLRQEADGALSGHSLVSAALNHDAIAADAVVQSQPITGRIRFEGGEHRIEIQVAGEGGVTVYSEEFCLRTETPSLDTREPSSGTSAQTFSYGWTAARMR